MKVTDPRVLLDMLDRERFEEFLETWTLSEDEIKQEIQISEPAPFIKSQNVQATTCLASSTNPLEMSYEPTIVGKVQSFGDHIDTDGIF